MGKISELEIFLNDFNSVDFLCFNETCLSGDQMNQLTIAGFKLSAHFCRSSKKEVELQFGFVQICKQMKFV